ncbi:MAG: DUF3999 domain-containing protein [Gammaproteobacteria bacterium]|nr:DUF3999 domain-containing protein [Gammaproteobacteria bacterium]
MKSPWTFVLLLMATGLVHAEQLRRDDFAYEAPIALHGVGSVYRAPLTAEVYGGVVRADLGDLRVFNAAGEEVPIGLSRPMAAVEKKRVSLPLFVLPVKEAQTADDISLKIERSNNGSIVSVNAGSTASANRLVYLVDASQINQRIGALEIAWQVDMGTGFVATLQVEESADLKNWRPLAQGALAYLQRDGQVLEQRRIAIAPQSVKYLRLSWVGAAVNAKITGVGAELQEQTEHRRDWIAPASQAATKPGEYPFRLDGKMPVDYARVLLPVNSVAHVVVLTRNSDGDNWEPRGAKTLYRLDSGTGEVKDIELALGRSGFARQWLLRLDQPASTLGAMMPALELGWIPHDLVFVARGGAPFSLAYGSVSVSPAFQAVDELVRQLQSANVSGIELQPAAFGTSHILRGEAALAGGFDWRRWLLWGVLLLGVAILAALAVRLLRQLNAPS